MKFNSSLAYKENPADPDAEKPINVFIIYETILTCLIAKILSERIPDYTSRKVNTSWYSFGNLVNENPHMDMFTHLESSDIILLAKAGKTKLPEPVTDLMNSCTDQNSKTGKPILGIFALGEEEILEDLAPFRQLQNLSFQTGMEFLGLSYVLSRVERCDSRNGFATNFSPDELGDFLRRNFSPGPSTVELTRKVIG